MLYIFEQVCPNVLGTFHGDGIATRYQHYENFPRVLGEFAPLFFLHIHQQKWVWMLWILSKGARLGGKGHSVAFQGVYSLIKILYERLKY